MDRSSAADVRFDCFVSFPGSQKLRDLGFTWAGPDDTVRDLAREVSGRLRGFQRNPSVFYDHSELKGDPYRDDLSKAVLQLRGGGVALVLLTAEYLRRKWCIAELRAFLQLHKLHGHVSRSGEAVVIRIVCLDSVDAIKSALCEHTDGLFVGGPEGVEKFQWQSLGQEPSEGTRALVLNQICGHVLDYWGQNQSLCLGKSRLISLMYMKLFFVTTPVSLISGALGVTAPEAVPRSLLAMFSFLLPSVFGGSDQDGLTREYAFSQALQQGSLSHQNLLALLQVATDVDAKYALHAYRRKWISDGWSWSIESAGENDVCLPRFVEEASGVLPVGQDENRRRETSSASTSATPIPVVDQTTKFPNGDVFRPHLPNRQHLSEGLEDSAATSLARLKSAVLPAACPSDGSNDGSRSTSPASSSSLRHVALTSINGEGGVGKTSTCKLLCSDVEVRSHFGNGAILWIDVGQGAIEEAVVTELRKAVSRCGGKHTAEEIGSSSDIFEAVDITCEFFSKRRILVIVDNVWETPAMSKVVSWAVALAKVATFPGSAVIMTARFSLLSESSGFDRVDLGRLDLGTEGSPDWRIAEHLYDALLNATNEELLAELYVTDRRKALKLTCGLPLAIKTLAGVVRSRLRVGDDVSSVLAKIEKRSIGLADKFVGKDMIAATGHPGLFAAMEESLAFLDEQKGCRVKSAPLSVRKYADGNNSRVFSANYGGLSDRPLSSRYAALKVMSASSTSISLEVLCRLWHLQNVEEAENTAILFFDVGLGRIENSSLGNDRAFCLHDLQYEFCVGMRDSVDGHALLLSSCESLLDPEKDGHEIGMGWTSFCFAEVLGLPEQILRQYLAQNLFRHLCDVVSVVNVDGVSRTVCHLLSDFRWLRGRMTWDGNADAVSDCILALASRAGAGPRLLTGGAELSIRALQESLMLVGDGLLRRSDEALAGVLFQLAQSSLESGDSRLDITFFRRLASSTEENVHGTWLKPILKCSRARRGEGTHAQTVVGSGDRVWSIAVVGDNAHFVSGSADGAVRVHEIGSLGSVLELIGHSDDVNCVCVSKKDGVEGSFLLFSGSDDCTIRFWEVGLNPLKMFVEEASGVVGDCEFPVWCLSVSRNGDLVAAGCGSGAVCIWKRREGDAVLRFERVTSFSCAISGKESGWVRGVAISRWGDFVVAGEQNGGTAFWSGGEAGSEGTVDRCCASDGSDAELWQVLLSADESTVSFVFSNPAGCEVWDVASRRRLSPRVALPDFITLTCATLSTAEEACGELSGAQGFLVFGGWDESGQNFISLHSCGNDFKVLSKYYLASAPRSVFCTSFAGGRRIFVGSNDGSVYMLEADELVASDGAETCRGGARLLGSGHSEASDAPEMGDVSNVTVMPTTELVVSGHEGGRFNLWRAEDGKFVHAFGDERGDDVLCVDISTDEGLAVSGHANGAVLVWDASTWGCRFALEGHPENVACATISANAKRIVTVGWGGELRVWDAEIGGAAQLTTLTGLKFSFFGSRGAISRDGYAFLWATRSHEDGADLEWRAKVIDLSNGMVIWQSTEELYCDWDMFLQTFMAGKTLDGKKGEVWWEFGAVCGTRYVELRDDDSGQQSADLWRVSSGDERGIPFPRVDCRRGSAEGGAVHPVTSLRFDSYVKSINARWISSEAGGRRRAVVACGMDGKSYPAIMHLIPAND